MDDNINGMFGIEELGTVNQLRKALEVGYETNAPDKTGFGATRIESLDSTLKVQTADQKSAKFWQAIKKDKAYSTNEEFTTVEELGGANFYSEGGISEEYDELLRREYEKVKYMGAVGRIPNVAMEVRSIVNNLETITKLKTNAIIRKLDVKLFFGNEKLVPTEFNGILAQFMDRVKYPTQNVIDLQGKRITPEILSQVGLTIQENYGDPGNIMGWVAPSALQGYKKELMDNRTFMVTDSINNLQVNTKKFELDETVGSIETDLFLRHKGETYLEKPHPKLNPAGNAFAAEHEKAPKTLDSTTFTATAASDSTSKLPAATYDYCVVPVNRYGAGAGFEVKSVAVTSNQKVNFTISDNGSPAGQIATAFDVYRKLSTATALTEYRYLCTFGTADTKVDNGEHVPGTSYAFFMDWDFDQVLTFKQLLPFMRQELAVIDDSRRFFFKLYGTPIVFNPNKIVVLKNVGQTAHS